MIVVLGHSIILYSSEWGLYSSIYSVPFLDMMKKVINLVQMPLFFSLSGFLLYRDRKIGFKKFVFKKMQRLLIPFLCISLLWMVPIKCAVGYRNYQFASFWNIYLEDIILQHDTGHLWFLPTLFFGLIICYWTDQLSEQNDRKLRIFALTIFAFMNLFSGHISVSLVANVMQNTIWIYLGNMFHYYNDQIRQDNNTLVKVAASILSILSLVIAIKHSIAIFNIIVSAFSVLTFYLCVPNKQNAILGFLSKYSFGIYLIHSPLVYITYTYFANANPGLVFILNFFVFGLVAILLSMLLTNSPLKVLLGLKVKNVR